MPFAGLLLPGICRKIFEDVPTLVDGLIECFEALPNHEVLIIDELVDNGIIMAEDSKTILKRISVKTSAASKGVDKGGARGPEAGSAQTGGSMFAAVFASARNQIAKSLFG